MKQKQHGVGRGSSWDALLSRAARRVRVLDGPLLGATYKVWSGIRFGRQSTADILMLLPEVSRQHAQLVEDAHGDHWLMDLDSSNGTWIGAQRIARQLLLPGTVFRIGDVRCMYEDEPLAPPADASSEVLAVSYHHAPARRSTRELRVQDDRGLEAARGTGDDHRGTSRTQVVEAVGDDGERYEGSVVDDLVEYRGLRLRMRRYGLGATGLLDRFEQLEGRLCGPREPSLGEAPGHGLRSFGCQLPAGLRMLDGTSHITTVRWLGVGGAEIESPRLPAGLGEVVWLAFELVVAGRPRTVVSTCRVSWIDRDRAHLSFVGLSDDMAVVSQAFEPTMAGPRPVVPTQDSSFAGASLRG